MAMEASLVGKSKSFVTREAMERGHRGRPSRLDLHTKPWISEACLVEEICMRSHGYGACLVCLLHVNRLQIHGAWS